MEKAAVEWINTNLSAEEAKIALNVFPANSILTVDDIKKLTKPDLEELKFNIGQRNRILKAIAGGSAEEPAPAKPVSGGQSSAPPSDAKVPSVPTVAPPARTSYAHGADSRVLCDKGHAMTPVIDRQSMPANYQANATISCDRCKASNLTAEKAKSWMGLRTPKVPATLFHCTVCDTYDLCETCATKMVNGEIPALTDPDDVPAGPVFSGGGGLHVKNTLERQNVFM